MYIRIEQDKLVDPRILRTREVLINSFAKLLVERKSIRKVSVLDVAQLAGVNRVTFYAHFRDKYELLDVWARLMFKQQVIELLPEDALLNMNTLTMLVSATLDFLIYRNKYRRRINEQFESIFEAAIQQELQIALASLLERAKLSYHSAHNNNVATFLSWAIFGSLVEQSQFPQMQSNEACIKGVVTNCEALLPTYA